MKTINKFVFFSAIILIVLLLPMLIFANGNKEDRYDHRYSRHHVHNDYYDNYYDGRQHNPYVKQLFWNEETQSPLRASELKQQDKTVLETLGRDIQQFAIIAAIIVELPSENLGKNILTKAIRIQNLHNDILQEFDLSMPATLSVKNTKKTLDTTDTVAIHKSLVSTAYSIGNTIQKYSDNTQANTALLPYLALLQKGVLYYIQEGVYILALQNEQVSPEITNFIQAKEPLLAYNYNGIPNLSRNTHYDYPYDDNRYYRRRVHWDDDDDGYWRRRRHHGCW